MSDNVCQTIEQWARPEHMYLLAKPFLQLGGCLMLSRKVGCLKVPRFGTNFICAVCNDGRTGRSHLIT